MTNMWSTALGLLLVPIAAAIDHPVTNERSFLRNIPVKSIAGSQELSFEIISRGVRSGITGDLMRGFKKKSSFERFWAKHGSWVFPPEPVPDVDFDSQMVIIVFVGNRLSTGYWVDITSVVQTPEGALIASYTEERPGDDCYVGGLETQPYEIISVDTTGVKKVGFLGSVNEESCNEGNGHEVGPGKSVTAPTPTQISRKRALCIARCDGDPECTEKCPDEDLDSIA